MILMDLVITKHAFEQANKRGLNYKNIYQLCTAIKKAHKKAKFVKRGFLKGLVYGTKDIVYSVVRDEKTLVVTTVFGDKERFKWEIITNKRQIKLVNK